ncbi:MAG: heavy metal-responsive transcriptional regulator [Thermodesulfobacteriota bacterium]
MEGTFTIGELAGRAGVNVQTVHYYERRGLLLPVGRKGSGYRVYDEAALTRLRFIRHAKGLGFTLEEIRGLLDLSLDTTASCESVREKAALKLKDVKERIKTLESVGRVLEELVEACNKRRPTEKCPILRIMEEAPGKKRG